MNQQLIGAAAGGTHEIVKYYDMVRFLLWNCWERRTSKEFAESRLNQPVADLPVAEARRLETVRDAWMQTPEEDSMHPSTPASLIDHERARLPEGVTGAEAMVDCDCPCCQMMAEDAGPYFWHLDGCNMDDDFAFSFHRTREEWQEEQRQFEEMSRKIEEERLQRGENSSSPWQASYVNPDMMGQSPALIAFGLSAHLAELTQNLKDAGADQELIDRLNHAFGNVRAVMPDPSAALVEPVIERMNELLAAIAEAYPALSEKCADLEHQLTEVAKLLADGPAGEDSGHSGQS